jgi:hypothetical protein
MAGTKPLIPESDDLAGFVIPTLNLKVTASAYAIVVKYADGKPIPLDQQVAILNRIRDSFLAALAGPIK